MVKLGASGKFPEGKIDQSDEGELTMAIHVTDDGLVRLDFGKPVAWFAVPAKQARELGRLLIKHSKNAGPQ